MLQLKCPVTPPQISSEIFEYMEYADVLLTPTGTSNSNSGEESNGNGGADGYFSSPQGSAQAHKSILSQVSPFLKEIFDSNPDSHQILLPDVSIDTIVRILALIYKGSCVCESQGDICEVIKVIEMLHISAISSFNVYNTPTVQETIPPQIIASPQGQSDILVYEEMEGGKGEESLISNGKQLLALNNQLSLDQEGKNRNESACDAPSEATPLDQGKGLKKKKKMKKGVKREMEMTQQSLEGEESNKNTTFTKEPKNEQEKNTNLMGKERNEQLKRPHQSKTCSELTLLGVNEGESELKKMKGTPPLAPLLPHQIINDEGCPNDEETPEGCQWFNVIAEEEVNNYEGHSGLFVINSDEISDGFPLHSQPISHLNLQPYLRAEATNQDPSQYGEKDAGLEASLNDQQEQAHALRAQRKDHAYAFTKKINKKPKS